MSAESEFVCKACGFEWSAIPPADCPRCRQKRMKTYVLGFLFDDVGQAVVLIRKRKPAWQSGFLNGVGGKMEPEDALPCDAMARESVEEIGVSPAWEPFGKLVCQDSLVFLFRAFDTAAFDAAKTMEAEEVEKVFVLDLENELVLPNLPWLVRMAQDDEVSDVLVRYSDPQ